MLRIEDLRSTLETVTSASDTRALLNRAARVAGVPRDRPLALHELLVVCEALAAEGGPVQRIAEDVATRALHP